MYSTRPGDFQYQRLLTLCIRAVINDHRTQSYANNSTLFINSNEKLRHICRAGFIVQIGPCSLLIMEVKPLSGVLNFQATESTPNETEQRLHSGI